MERPTFIPEEEQRKMFAGLIENTLQQDYNVCLDPSVKRALIKVDRRNFIPEEYHEHRFEDNVIPLQENESSISQPLLVARMLHDAAFTGSEKALEVGTAVGMNAAYMSHLAQEVHTIEYSEALARQAKENLAREGRSNVTVHIGDGLVGLPAQAPFDRIIVTAGARTLPVPLLDQLAVGGKMVIPIGEHPYTQALYTIEKTTEEDVNVESSLNVHFVPLISNEVGGWPRGLINELKIMYDEYNRNAQAEESGGVKYE